MVLSHDIRRLLSCCHNLSQPFNRYCGTECSHADWRAGHKRMCKRLAAAKQHAAAQP